MASRAVSLIIALLVLAGCDRGRGQAPGIQARLDAAVASGATSFDFAAAEPTFVWDRMHVFGCYSDRASVEKALGVSWPDFDKTTIASSDSVVLVVFVRDGAVVGWYEQPRDVELGSLENDTGYTPTEALFDIDRDSGRIELKPRAPAEATSISGS